MIAAAAATVMLATRIGIPISTTHALTGALMGAGWLASPEGVDLARLGSNFFAPLLISPFLGSAQLATGRKHRTQVARGIKQHLEESLHRALGAVIMPLQVRL